MNYNEYEQKNAYWHHRYRVKNATAIIDDKAPQLITGNYARFSHMKDDIATEINRNKVNMQLLAALNKVFRTKGKVNTFRTKENSVTPPYSKLQQKLLYLDKLDIANMHIGKKILCVKGDLDTWLDDRFKRKRPEKPQIPFQYPTLVMEKYSQVDIPRDSLQQEKYFRPKIWFNLEVKGVRPLGRIVIELYTEAAPQVVLEFVQLCFAKKKERITFIRLFPRLWLEGEISLDKNTLLGQNIEYDKRSLNHGEHNGVLSFNYNLVRKPLSSSHPIFNFTLSFKPLSACNGHRIGFGRVCSGFKLLSCIEDFGTKNGKPSKEVIVSNCGISN